MSSLLRSTKFVRYFAGAARTLIINSAKTAETSLLSSSKILSSANNALRDYSTSKKTESLEPLLQRLDNEVRRYGRISKKDIDEVFDEIRAKHSITSSQSLLVIRCCGELVPEELPEQRTLLVQKIWSVLTERGVPMDISHYNALLKVYIENEHPFSPAEFLEELEKKGLQPNRVTYQRLMWRYCQEGDVEGATRVLEKMREVGFPVSEPVLNALVMGHAFHGDTDGAKAVLETMATAGLQPTNKTYSLLACGHARKGDIEGVQNIIKLAEEKDAFLTDKDVLDIIESLALSGHGDKIEAITPNLQKGALFLTDLCNLILRLINKGHEDIAKKLLTLMEKSQKTEDSMYKGAFFVKQLVKVQKSPEKFVKMCKELQDENLIPSALYIATESVLQHGRTDCAQLLFKELANDGFEIRQHYYWPLLIKKGKENDEEGLLQLVREMNKNGLNPTGETLRDYVIPYLKNKNSAENIILKLQIADVPAIRCARNLMVELLESGDIKQAASIALQYRPYGQHSLIGRPLLKALTKTKDLKSFVSILHVISSRDTLYEDTGNEEAQKNDDKDGEEINRIVISAVKILQNNDHDRLFEELLSKGLRISTQSAETIEQILGENLTSSISEKLAKLVSPELELTPLERRVSLSRTTPDSSARLEKLLTSTKQKEAGNIPRLEKQLLTAYIAENEVEKVEKLLKEFEEKNTELSVASLAKLIEFYAVNDNIEAALKYKSILHKQDPEFLLNKYKLVQVAYALVKANRFEEALKFLAENSADTFDNNVSFLLNSTCFQMLNYCAEQKDAAKVKQLTEVLLEKNFVEPTNVLLGSLIKVHLLDNNVEAALKEFEFCCKQYRSTPWKGELMKALILKEDATQLQTVADLSTQIHGEVNTLHDLVLAFVECGRLRQARRILETPGMQTRNKRLNDACERYVQTGKSEYLEGLLEATKELSYIDRSNIFYHLLKSYCKANETDKALGLWTLLQEEGEAPSEEFLHCLGEHLKANNRDVPFIIPESKTQSVKAVAKPERTITKPAIRRENINKATKEEATIAIENLVKSGKTVEAMDVTISYIEKGTVPKHSVLKYLLKNLAEEGDVEQIKRLENYATESLRRNITYDDKLTLALVKSGSGAQHVRSLAEALNNANSEADMQQLLTKYPRSNALAKLIGDEEIKDLCHKIADKAASNGLMMPANLLWMELLLSDKEKEADEIWNKHLVKSETLAFRRLLQESHVRNEPRFILKLIDQLKTNKNISVSAVGNAHARLINLYIEYNNVSEAKKVLDRAIEDGIPLKYINNTTLEKLKTALERNGERFAYEIPSPKI